MSGFLPLLSTVTAADVAAAVRTELATELAEISALPTLAEIEASTVLAKAADIPTVPTATDIADAVWSKTLP